MYYSDYWYILFVTTGQEQKALYELKRAFINDEVTPFLPCVEKFFRKHGLVKKEKHLMFPGYIFVETPMTSVEFILKSAETIRKSKYIMKLLRYGHTHEAAVLEAERKSISSLWKKSHCIETSQGFIVGDKVFITDGPLVGVETIIRRINRHKMQADVELKVFGKAHIVSIGLEIIKKIPKNDNCIDLLKE